MSSDNKVVQLFRVNQFAPTAEAQAAFLEDVVERIRDGSLQIERAVLIFQPPTGVVTAEPFGCETTNMELVGLIEFAKHRLLYDFHDED